MLRTTITASHAQLAELTVAVLDHYSNGKDLMHALFSIVIEEQGLLSDPKVQEAVHG